MLLLFANKQDLPNAMAISEMTDKLGLQSLRSRTVSAELAWLLTLASLIVYHKNNLSLKEREVSSSFCRKMNVVCGQCLRFSFRIGDLEV